MPTLVYKRTHIGDPDENGVFGIHDCMGHLRDLDFDAVIGIGATGSEAKSHGIDGKINWIGTGAHKTRGRGRGSSVIFDHFQLFDGDGEQLSLEAPALARRFYSHPAPRYVLNDFSKAEQAEIELLLATVQKKPPSKGGKSPGRPIKCPHKRPPKRC